MTSDARGRDASRFQTLIEPHFDRLFRLAARLTGNRADAEDLIQEVLTRLYGNRARLDSLDDPGTYLCRVLYNQFIDGYRAAQRRPLKLVDNVMTLDRADPDADPARLNEADHRRQRLNQALARLREDHRQLLLLHDGDGYTLRELHAITGLPVGTLKSRLSRARARLKDLLRDLDDSAAEKKMEPIGGSRRVNG